MKYLTKEYWIKRRQYKYIINWINRAESYYKIYVITRKYNHYTLGLCMSFVNTFKKTNLFNLNKKIIKYFGANYIVKIIPEFNYKTFNGNRPDLYHGYWWDKYDVISRFEAFNLIRNIYINKLKEL